MLGYPITYTFTNDEGKEVKETTTFWFNLSQREFAELDLLHEGQTFEEWYVDVTKRNDRKALYDFFKEVVLLSHGIRYDEGRRFKKTPEIREDFASSAAYEALFDEWFEEENKMLVFFKSVLPEQVRENWDKALAQVKAGELPGATAPKPEETVPGP